MALGCSISGIGYPMYGMGLGNLGLGGYNGYSSMDAYMPTTLGMNSSLFGVNGMNGMYGMYGMYNPQYLANMQQNIEASQIAHAGNMHTAMKDMEVSNHRRTDNALIEKVLTNGDITNGVKNLAISVQKGDQDAICMEFDRLQTLIFNRYRDELVGMNGEINPRESATEIIQTIYQNMTQSNLESDIVRYGEGAFENGFYSGFRSGHCKRHTDETLNHCFGRRIENAGSKNFREGVGRVVGGGASALEKAVYGGAAGAASYTILKGVEWLGKYIWRQGSPRVDFNPKTMGKVGMVVAGVAAVGDVIWQLIRD